MTDLCRILLSSSPSNGLAVDQNTVRDLRISFIPSLIVFLKGLSLEDLNTPVSVFFKLITESDQLSRAFHSSSKLFPRPEELARAELAVLLSQRRVPSVVSKRDSSP